MRGKTKEKLMNKKNTAILLSLSVFSIATGNASFEQFAKENPALFAEIVAARQQWRQLPATQAWEASNDDLLVCAKVFKSGECDELYKKFCDLRTKTESTSEYKKYQEIVTKAGDLFKKRVEQ